MNRTLDTLPDPDISTIIPYTGAKHPKTGVEMTYLENKSIDRDICQKLMKKDIYEKDMHNIYSLIVGQTNKQLHKKVALESTTQAVKTGQEPIGYIMIPKKLFFSNQYDQHPISSLCLETR